MKLLSVNVGLPRDVEWNGRTIRTSIFKAPVSGRVHVRKLNLDGDQQSDLTVHGGVDKAVYVYPSEHSTSTAIHTSSAVTASHIVKMRVWSMQPLPKLTR